MQSSSVGGLDSLPSLLSFPCWYPSYLLRISFINPSYLLVYPSYILLTSLSRYRGRYNSNPLDRFEEEHRSFSQPCLILARSSGRPPQTLADTTASAIMTTFSITSPANAIHRCLWDDCGMPVCPSNKVLAGATVQASCAPPAPPCRSCGGAPTVPATVKVAGCTGGEASTGPRAFWVCSKSSRTTSGSPVCVSWTSDAIWDPYAFQ